MPRYVENSFSKKANKGKKNLKTIGKLATAAGTTAYASYADSTKKSYSNKNNNINPSIPGCLIGLLFVIIGLIIAFTITDDFTSGAISVVLSSIVGLFIFYFMSKATNGNENRAAQQQETIHTHEIPYHPEQLGDEYARFALTQEGERTLFVIGLNPSTADAQKPDPTMQSVLRIAAYNGFDGFIMLNLYPFRASQPYNLPKEFDKELHEKNLQIISELLKGRENIAVWLAFGANITKREYLKQCFDDIVKVMMPYNPKWYYINNLTKEGYPPHPLYQNLDYFKSYSMESLQTANM